MFCHQDTYTPKSLDCKGFQSRRIQIQTGSSEKKPSFKYNVLRSYLDYDFSYVTATMIAQEFHRYIKRTRKHKKETTAFVKDVLNKILFLHSYNLKVAEVTSKYPFTINFTQLLLHYVVLECNVLYRREFYSLRYEVVVKKRIWRTLFFIYNAYIETFITNVSFKKLYEESAKAILNLLIKVKPEFDIENKLLENMVILLLNKIGKLEKVTALKNKSIPCPLDTYLSDPTVGNAYKNIITSDYGTDDDSKIEEKQIPILNEQEQNGNEDTESLDAGIKLETDDIFGSSQNISDRSYQESPSKSRPMVPTIYIDDDNDFQMIYFEEEVRTSNKSLRILEKEEEKTIKHREKRNQAFSNHRPFKEDILNDIKPDVKEENTDLNSTNETHHFSTLFTNSNNNYHSIPSILMSDTNKSHESTTNVSEDVAVSKYLEAYDTIPKEREIELLRDDDDDDVVIVEENTNTGIQKENARKIIPMHSKSRPTSAISSGEAVLSELPQDIRGCCTDSVKVEENMCESLPTKMEDSEHETRDNVQSRNDTVALENIIKIENLEIEPSKAIDLDDPVNKLSLDFYKNNTISGPKTDSRDKIPANFAARSTETDIFVDVCDKRKKDVTSTEQNSIVNNFEILQNNTNTAIVPETNDLVNVEMSNVCGIKNKDICIPHNINQSLQDKTEDFTATSEVGSGSKEMVSNVLTINSDPAGIRDNELCGKQNKEVSISVSSENVNINLQDESTDKLLIDCMEMDEEINERRKLLKETSRVLTTRIAQNEIESKTFKSDVSCNNNQNVVDTTQNIKRNLTGPIEMTDSVVTDLQTDSQDCIKESVSTGMENTIENTEFKHKEITVAPQEVAIAPLHDNIKCMESEVSYEQTNEEPKIIRRNSDFEENSSGLSNTTDKGHIEDERGNSKSTCNDLQLTQTENASISDIMWDVVVGRESNSHFIEETKLIERSETVEKLMISAESLGDNSATSKQYNEEDTFAEFTSQAKNVCDQQPTNNIKVIRRDSLEESTKTSFNNEQNVQNFLEKNTINALNYSTTRENSEEKCIIDENGSTTFDKSTEAVLPPNEKVGEIETVKVSGTEFEKSIQKEQEKESTINANYNPENSKIPKNKLLASDNVVYMSKIFAIDYYAVMKTLETRWRAERITGTVLQKGEVEECQHEEENFEVMITRDTEADHLDKENGFECDTSVENVLNTSGEDRLGDINNYSTTALEESVEPFDNVTDYAQFTVVNSKGNLEVSREQADIYNEENAEIPIEEIRNSTNDDHTGIEYTTKEIDNVLKPERTSDEIIDTIDTITENATEKLTEKSACTEIFEENDQADLTKLVNDSSEESRETNKYHLKNIKELHVTDLENSEVDITGIGNIYYKAIENFSQEQVQDINSTNVTDNYDFVYEERPSSTIEQESLNFDINKTSEFIKTEQLHHSDQKTKLLVDFNVQQKKAIECSDIDDDIDDTVHQFDTYKNNEIEHINQIVPIYQSIPEKVVHSLEACEVPDKTSLHILATVAAVAREDLLRIKRSKNGTIKGRKKTISKIKSANKKCKETRRITPTLDFGDRKSKHNVENNVVKSNDEQKCKPHDFLVNNTKIIPPANNIYTQKLTENCLTSEDSNDSEGNLLIDEGIDTKLKETQEAIKKGVVKNVTCYDEDTLDEVITCPYEPRVKGTVFISIPDNNCHDSFDILKQIEELKPCSSTNPVGNCEKDVNEEKMNEVGKKLSHFGAEFDISNQTANGISTMIETTDTTDNIICYKKSNAIAIPKEIEIIKGRSCRPFKTMAERKDYDKSDKLELNAYVSIERLKDDIKYKKNRSKSFDINIIRNSESNLNRHKEINETTINKNKASEDNNLGTLPSLAKPKSPLPKSKYSNKGQVENKRHSGSDSGITDTDFDNVPLSQRAFNTHGRMCEPRIIAKKVKGKVFNRRLKPKKHLKKISNNVKSDTKRKDTKIEKNRNQISGSSIVKNNKSQKKLVKFDKSAKGSCNEQQVNLSNSDLRVNPRNSSPKKSINAKKPENINVGKDTALLKSDTHLKENAKKKILLNDKSLKSEDTNELNMVQNLVNSSQVEKKFHNSLLNMRNKSDTNKAVTDDKKNLVNSSHKKYYRPPKLRRKPVMEIENADTKDILPRKSSKQLKLTSKTDMLSRCKNTVSPTTEKLKKKLEIDYNLSCRKILLDEISMENHSCEITEVLPNSVNIDHHETASQTEALHNEGRKNVEGEQFNISHGKELHFTNPTKVKSDEIETCVRVIGKKPCKETENFEKTAEEQICAQMIKDEETSVPIISGLSSRSVSSHEDIIENGTRKQEVKHLPCENDLKLEGLESCKLRKNMETASLEKESKAALPKNCTNTGTNFLRVEDKTSRQNLSLDNQKFEYNKTQTVPKSDLSNEDPTSGMTKNCVVVNEDSINNIPLLESSLPELENAVIKVVEEKSNKNNLKKSVSVTNLELLITETKLQKRQCRSKSEMHNIEDVKIQEEITREMLLTKKTNGQELCTGSNIKTKAVSRNQKRNRSNSSNLSKEVQDISNITNSREQLETWENDHKDISVEEIPNEPIHLDKSTRNNEDKLETTSKQNMPAIIKLEKKSENKSNNDRDCTKKQLISKHSKKTNEVSKHKSKQKSTKFCSSDISTTVNEDRDQLATKVDITCKNKRKNYKSELLTSSHSDKRKHERRKSYDNKSELPTSSRRNEHDDKSTSRSRSVSSTASRLPSDPGVKKNKKVDHHKVKRESNTTENVVPNKNNSDRYENNKNVSELKLEDKSSKSSISLLENKESIEHGNSKNKKFHPLSGESKAIDNDLDTTLLSESGIDIDNSSIPHNHSIEEPKTPKERKIIDNEYRKERIKSKREQTKDKKQKKECKLKAEVQNKLLVNDIQNTEVAKLQKPESERSGTTPGDTPGIGKSKYDESISKIKIDDQITETVDNINNTDNDLQKPESEQSSNTPGIGKSKYDESISKIKIDDQITETVDNINNTDNDLQKPESVQSSDTPGIGKSKYDESISKIKIDDQITETVDNINNTDNDLQKPESVQSSDTSGIGKSKYDESISKIKIDDQITETVDNINNTDNDLQKPESVQSSDTPGIGKSKYDESINKIKIDDQITETVDNINNTDNDLQKPESDQLSVTPGIGKSKYDELISKIKINDRITDTVDNINNTDDDLQKPESEQSRDAPGIGKSKYDESISKIKIDDQITDTVDNINNTDNDLQKPESEKLSDTPGIGKSKYDELISKIKINDRITDTVDNINNTDNDLQKPESEQSMDAPGIGKSKYDESINKIKVDDQITDIVDNINNKDNDLQKPESEKLSDTPDIGKSKYDESINKIKIDDQITDSVDNINNTNNDLQNKVLQNSRKSEMIDEINDDLIITHKLLKDTPDSEEDQIKNEDVACGDAKLPHELKNEENPNFEHNKEIPNMFVTKELVSTKTDQALLELPIVKDINDGDADDETKTVEKRTCDINNKDDYNNKICEDGHIKQNDTDDKIIIENAQVQEFEVVESAGDEIERDICTPTTASDVTLVLNENENENVREENTKDENDFIKDSIIEATNLKNCEELQEIVEIHQKKLLQKINSTDEKRLMAQENTNDLGNNTFLQNNETNQLKEMPSSNHENKENKDISTTNELTHSIQHSVIQSNKICKIHPSQVKLQNIQTPLEKSVPSTSTENKTIEQPDIVMAKMDNKSEDQQIFNSTSRKRKNEGFINRSLLDINLELHLPLKKNKFEEINSSTSFSETPKQLSPTGSSKKKERKSIEAVISHLVEEQASKSLSNREISKFAVNSTPIVDTVDMKLENVEELSQDMKKISLNIIPSTVENFSMIRENHEEPKAAVNIETDMLCTSIAENIPNDEVSKNTNNQLLKVNENPLDSTVNKSSEIETSDLQVAPKLELEDDIEENVHKGTSVTETKSDKMVSDALPSTSNDFLNLDGSKDDTIITDNLHDSNITDSTASSTEFKNDSLHFETDENNVIELRSFDNGIESAFVDDSTHIATVEQNSMQSLDPCAADFSSTDADNSNILNLSDLMMNVHANPADVTNMGEITISPEDICMFSDIISTTISSVESKLFSFPITSQANMKDQFTPLNDVSINKDLLDQTNTTELGSHEDKSCVFSFNEQIGSSVAESIGSSELSLNLQDVPFNKIPIGSTQTLDLISPKDLSVVQSSSSRSFMNQVPSATCNITRSIEPDDHNYSGDPLLSGRQEEKDIFSNTLKKNIVSMDKPLEFTSVLPLNDNQLQEFSEFGDDTYKLNLDNEYAVKTVVMLAEQTSSNVYPLSNYNLADIERMNIIECSISNSEENSNNKEYLEITTDVEQTNSSANDINPWTQFIMNEDPNQKVVVLSNEQCFTPPLSQNDLIQFQNQIVESAIPTSTSINEICTPLNPSKNTLKDVKPDPEVCTQKIPAKEKPETLTVNCTPLNTSKNTLKGVNPGPEVCTQEIPAKEKPEMLTVNKNLQNPKNLPNKPAQVETLKMPRIFRTVLKAPPQKKSSHKTKAVQNEISDTSVKSTLTEVNTSTTSIVENKPIPTNDTPIVMFGELPQIDSGGICGDFNNASSDTKSNTDLLVSETQSQIIVPSQDPLPTLHNSKKVPVTQSGTVNTDTSKSCSLKEIKKDFSENLPDITENVCIKNETIQENLVKSSKTCKEKLDVQSNIADLVKSRKRAATNKYSTNYKPPNVSTTKELPSQPVQLMKLKSPSIDKSFPENVAGVALPKSLVGEEDKKRTSDLCVRSDVVLKDTLDKSSNISNSSKKHLRPVESYANKRPSDQPLIEAPKKICNKNNYSIDRILSKDSKSNSNNWPYENELKDNIHTNIRGQKRSSVSTEEDDRRLGRVDKKQIKQRTSDPQAAEDQIDPFDKLREQGCVNERICLRITEDNKIKAETRSSPLRKSGKEEQINKHSHSRVSFPPAYEKSKLNNRREERRPESRQRPDNLPYYNSNAQKIRGGHHVNVSNRGREGSYSDYRGREAPVSHSRRYQSDYSARHYPNHGATMLNIASSSRVGFTRSSNVSESYYRKSSSHSSSSTANAVSHQNSAPYVKRNTKLSSERQEQLLNSLKDKVLDNLSSKDKKNSDEGAYSWLEKFTKTIDPTVLLASTNASTVQFPKMSGTRTERK